ncbi:hypothetical protein D3C83_73010 [compost metagenome]
MKFPGASTSAVAAAAIGEDQQFGCLVVDMAAAGFPPQNNRIDRERRRFVLGAADDETLIGLGV